MRERPYAEVLADVSRWLIVTTSATDVRRIIPIAKRLPKHPGTWTVPRTQGLARMISQGFSVSASGKITLETCGDLVADAIEARGYDHVCSADARRGPEDFWDHQRRAFAFTESRPGSLLGVKMAGGKTRLGAHYFETLARDRLHELRGGRINQKPAALVLCPKPVIATWVEEVDQWTSIPVAVYHPGRNPAGRVDRIKQIWGAWAVSTGEDCLMMVLNYEIARQEPLRSWLLGRRWLLTIFDECQRLATPGSKTSRLGASLAGCSDHRLGLSGTPIGNNELDLFGQLRAIEPAIFPMTWSAYKGRYGVASFGHPGIDEVRDVPEIMAAAKKACLIIDDLSIELPEVLHIGRPVTLPEKTQEVYDTAQRDLLIEVDDFSLEIPNILARCLRLQQIACGTVTDGQEKPLELEDAKFEALRDLIEELREADLLPVVVFGRFKACQFRTRLVADDLGLRWGELSGQRNDLDGPRYPEGVDVLGVNLQSGGLGVDLSLARSGVFVSTSYSSRDFDQAVARLIRPGQRESTVRFYNIWALGTIEKAISEAIKRKQNIAAEVAAYLSWLKGELE